jgi:hypothetical protein
MKKKYEKRRRCAFAAISIVPTTNKHCKRFFKLPIRTTSTSKRDLKIKSLFAIKFALRAKE